jgi:hypothetical protein
MRYTDPPFELGETLTGTDDNSNLINDSWLGQVFFIPAQRLSGGPTASKSRHTGKGITAVILRNTSGGTLAPKRIARMDFATAGEAGFETADQYCNVDAQKRPVIVDPFLPAGTTVADDDLFWGVLRGRCLVTTSVVADARNSIAVGDELVGLTSGATTDTTAGRAGGVTAGGGDTEALNMARNVIGYALSARTTNNTATDILIDACINTY